MEFLVIDRSKQRLVINTFISSRCVLGAPVWARGLNSPAGPEGATGGRHQGDGSEERLRAQQSGEKKLALVLETLSWFFAHPVRPAASLRAPPGKAAAHHSRLLWRERFLPDLHFKGENLSFVPLIFWSLAPWMTVAFSAGAIRAHERLPEGLRSGGIPGLSR